MKKSSRPFLYQLEVAVRFYIERYTLSKQILIQQRANMKIKELAKKQTSSTSADATIKSYIG